MNKFIAILIFGIYFSSCQSTKSGYTKEEINYLRSRINDGYPPFYSLSEKNKIDLISSIFQQQFCLNNIKSQINSESNSHKNLYRTIIDDQNALYFLPPTGCKLRMSIQKLDTLEKQSFIKLSQDILNIYDFYRINVSTMDGRIQFFCSGDQGTNNYINLGLDSTDYKNIKLTNYLLGIRKNSTFIIFSNDARVPNVIFLSSEFEQFETSKAYLASLLYKSIITSGNYSDIVTLLSFSTYDLSDLRFISENRNYVTYVFYSKTYHEHYYAHINKKHPEIITYKKVN